MKLLIGNSKVDIVDALPAETELIKSWCLKEYQYFGVDYTRFPHRHRKMTDIISYFGHNSFPTGWVGTFIRRLKDQKIKFEWIDNREKPLYKGYKDYPNSTPDPRDFQLIAHDIAIKRTRGIIDHATGSGKTLLMVYILRSLGFSALIFVPDRNLLMQTVKVFKKYLGPENVGYIGEGEKDIQLFTVATIQSLWSAYKRKDPSILSLLNTVDILFIDEGHHVNIAGRKKIHNTYFKLAQACDAYYRFSFTATPGEPGSLDRELLEAVTGVILHSVSSSELIRKGILARPSIKIYWINCRHRYNNWQTAYKENILKNTERNALIVRLAEKYAAEGKSVLISVNRVEDHGVVLHEMIEDSALMIGKTPIGEREEIFNAFSDKKIKVLVSTVVREGVDIPSMDVIILAGGGKSDKATVQRIGRALRRTKDKSTAIIIDFIDNDGGMLRKHSRARLRVYKSEEAYEIEEIKGAPVARGIR